MERQINFANKGYETFIGDFVAEQFGGEYAGTAHTRNPITNDNFTWIVIEKNGAEYAVNTNQFGGNRTGHGTQTIKAIKNKKFGDYTHWD